MPELPENPFAELFTDEFDERFPSGYEACCKRKRTIGRRRFDTLNPRDYGCPFCWCESQACEIKARPSGYCERHEGYHIQREENYAERALDDELSRLQRDVLGLALVALAPFHRALREIGEMQAARCEQQAADGIGAHREGRPELPVIVLDGAEPSLREWTGEGFKHRTAFEAPEALREHIRFSVEEIARLLTPGGDGLEAFCHPARADLLRDVGLIDRARKVAIYMEAVDE